MIRTRLSVRDNLGHITRRVEQLAERAVQVAATTAAETADAAESRVSLEIEVIPAHPTEVGVAAGIKSQRRGSKSGVRLAPLFSGGTLGKRTQKLATGRTRRASWTVTRAGTTYTAHRHEITAEMGIEGSDALRKGHRAGRAALKRTLREPL